MPPSGNLPRLAALIVFAAALVLPTPVRAQLGMGTAFTYQGSLVNAGQPANGRFDFEIALFDAQADPSAQLGATLSFDVNGAGAVTVVQGVFVVALDFGAAPFNGAARFLDIRVRPEDATDTAPFTTLAPRVPLNPAPYAQFAATADKLDGLDSTAFLLKAGGTMTGPLVVSTAAGDDSVILPNGAIGSQEIEDEAGVSLAGPGVVSISSGSGLSDLTVFAANPIIPSDGILVFLASGYMIGDPPGNSSVNIIAAVDGTSAAEREVTVVGADRTLLPGVVGAAFVSAGPHAIRLQATHVFGNAVAFFDVRPITIFLPTLY